MLVLQVIEKRDCAILKVTASPHDKAQRLPVFNSFRGAPETQRACGVSIKREVTTAQSSVHRRTQPTTKKQKKQRNEYNCC